MPNSCYSFFIILHEVYLIRILYFMRYYSSFHLVPKIISIDVLQCTMYTNTMYTSYHLRFSKKYLNEFRVYFIVLIFHAFSNFTSKPSLNQNLCTIFRKPKCKIHTRYCTKFFTYLSQSNFRKYILDLILYYLKKIIETCSTKDIYFIIIY